MLAPLMVLEPVFDSIFAFFGSVIRIPYKSVKRKLPQPFPRPPGKNKTHRASWRVGFGSIYDFQLLSSPFPPHRVGLAYSYPWNSKTNSKETPSIGHGCTKR